MAVALVTGGSGGIGEAITRRLCAAGHQVGIGYAHSLERAETLAKALANDGHTALPVRCDIGDRPSIAACLAELTEAWGPPLVLINNGGLRVTKPFLAVKPEEWDEAIRVNLTGTMSAMQLALPAMLEAGWGRVVNISSPSGQVPYSWGSTYGATKAGINLMSRVVAVEVARRGVTVNVVLPGIVQSDMIRTLRAEDVAKLVKDQAPGRLVEADEVGIVVTFLASDEARMVNGQEICVDGGGTLLVRYPDDPKT